MTSRKELFASGPDDRKRLRLGTNRQVEIALQQELHDVNEKTLRDIAVKKELKRSAPLTDEEKISRTVAPELKMPKQRPERKSMPVFHPDLQPREMSKDQLFLIPHVPPFDPPDKGPSVTMQSRVRKYPYVKGQIVSTDEMRKPKVSSVGVVPMRASLEVPGMNVMLTGRKTAAPDVDEIEMASRAQEVHPVPKLNLEKDEGDTTFGAPEKEEKKEEAEPPTSKPAILSSMGTIANVTMTQRAKPPPKPPVMHNIRHLSRQDFLDVQSSRSAGKSARSVQSSLLSDELYLPDEAVYSKYDDAITNIDADLETAVGGGGGDGDGDKKVTPAMKTMQQLLEEAKRIGSPGAEPIYMQNTAKPPSAKGKGDATAEARKSGRRSSKTERRKSAAKAAAGKAATEGEKERMPTERSVDEIVANLKQQASSGIMSEADKKIQEIMERVMSRTGSTSLFDTDELTSTESPELPAVSESGDRTLTDHQASLLSGDDDDRTEDTGDERVSGSLSPSDLLEESQREPKIPALIPEEEEPVDVTEVLSTHTGRTGDTLPVTVDGSTGPPAVPVGPYPSQEEVKEVPKQEEEVDVDMEEHLNIQQAWQDLLAPPEATYEDLVSVIGEPVDFHTRGIPGPNTANRINVQSMSVSFLSTWAPTGTKTKPKSGNERTVEPPTRSIHHFCKMTEEFQLPREFRNVGRKYHTPDMFAGVFPRQPYRFDAELLQAMEEKGTSDGQASTADSDRRQSEMAERIVREANELMEGATLEQWKRKAEEVMSQEDVKIDGQRIDPTMDESRVYWAPAPPKLEVAPAKVREILFPKYQSGQLDENGRLIVTAPAEPESESEEEEEEESLTDIEDKEMNIRIMSRKHQSCEDLTVLMKMEIRREELIHNKRLDPSTYRPLITPPPTPPEPEADPKAPAKEMPRGSTTRSPSREKAAAAPPPPETPTPDVDPASLRVTGPPDDSLFSPVYFPPPRRSRSMPHLIADMDDTLMVPLDFNQAMEELREQRQQLERAKRQRRIQDATDELTLLEVEEAQKQTPEEELQPPEAVTHVDILRISHTPKKEDELTPAEKALLAGRNYVILPRKKKKKARRPLDAARLEAIEKFLAVPPNKLTRRKSLPKVKRVVERELRVPSHVRERKTSMPNLLDFEEYKAARKFPRGADEREWTRDIWNKWFDEVFPPTPTGSEDEDDEAFADTGAGDADTQQRDEKKKGKESAKEILSEEIDAIEPLANTEENAEIIAILKEEVEKLTRMIDSITPPMAFDLARRGALYRKLGQLWKAEEDLNRAIKMEPMLLDAYWHRHLLYVLQDKKAAALEDLNFIMKHNKQHAGAYRSMAEIYRRQGDVTMAIVNFTQAIKMNPMDHDAYFQRAAMYEERGEKLLALEDYSKCMKLMPTRTDAIMKHGMHYFQNENWMNAINDFNELLRVDPLNAHGRLYRGLAYAKLSQWNPAVEDLSAAVHLDPNNWQAFYHRACVLRKAHPKRALQDYSVSLAINDGEENIMSYLHRGILYNSLGRPEDAIPDFEAVLKLNKDIACAHVNLGLIFMTKHQNYHRAIKKFTSAIKCDPTYVRAYVCRGEAYHKIHELKLALKDYTRAIHLRPDVHHYYMYRGQLVLELGNLDLAAFCVRHASEIGQGGAVSAFGDRPTQQAAVQSFLKNYEKAIDALSQATRVKPVAPLFMLLGKTQMKAKLFKEGATSFEKALELMRPWRQRDPWPPEAAEAHFLSGMCHMELRSYLPAFSSFNSAIGLDANYAEAYYQRGLARMKLKQSKGIQDFNRALAINPNIFQAYLSRACYYGLRGIYTKAILNCNEAIKLQPNSVRAYLYRGALKYHIKAFDLAIRDLTKAASIDNTCPLPYFNRAVCYQENKEYAKALTDYGIVLLLGDQLSLKVLINRGLLYFELGDYTNALHDFQNAAKLSPVDHRIHHTLGLCFHKLGRLQEAVSTFTQCLQLKPFFLDGLIARGNVYMDYGHEAGIVKARRDYERALRLDPLCLSARVNLAFTLQVTGKLMQAWRNFTIAIEMKHNFKPALEGRAIVNLQMSNTFAAFQDISSSIHIAPTAELLTNRGVINQFMNDRVNAMRDYQRAIQLDPKYSLAYFNAANVYFHTRHFNQALDYYNKAIENNQKDESAFLNRAITKVLLRDSKSALDDFKAALKLSPHSAHIYFNRANLYMAMQVYDKAEKDYTKALSLQPDDPMTLKRRADVRGKLGRKEEAIEDYRRAVDIQTRPHRVVQPQ